MALPSPLLTVPNVTAHPSTASVPTSYYSMWHYNCRVTTCLENLEMSGNLTAVREMSGILLKIREVSEKKILSGKSCLKLFIVNCIFVSIQVLVGVCSVLNVQYIMVSDRVLLHFYPHH